jgi:NAD(P)-dependent dehydrogenase (short-subunit alcohol dehydrogenase family)
MQAAFPVMREQGRGRIVTFGSNAALAGVATYAAYSATKEAIRVITRTAAGEWGRYGITVNCVCPVSVRHHTPGLNDPEALAKFERSFRPSRCRATADSRRTSLRSSGSCSPMPARS